MPAAPACLARGVGSGLVTLVRLGRYRGCRREAIPQHGGGMVSSTEGVGVMARSMSGMESSSLPGLARSRDPAQLTDFRCPVPICFTMEHTPRPEVQTGVVGQSQTDWRRLESLGRDGSWSCLVRETFPLRGNGPVSSSHRSLNLRIGRCTRNSSSCPSSFSTSETFAGKEGKEKRMASAIPLGAPLSGCQRRLRGTPVGGVPAG